MDRRRWQTIQHGCVRRQLSSECAGLTLSDRTVAYKQAALNAITYLMKIGYSTSALIYDFGEDHVY